MKKNSSLRYFQLLVCLLLVLHCHSAYSSPDDDFPVGSQLPRFDLPAPDSPQVQKYLGIKSKETFSLADIDSKCVLIEFLGVMCPVCHANAPLINRLYKVIQGDAALAKNVKMIGIAVGNDEKQLQAYQKNFSVPFPIFPDEGYALTGPIGGVATPTMVLATKNGKVLSSHRGGIQDLDAYLKDLREIIKKQ